MGCPYSNPLEDDDDFDWELIDPEDEEELGSLGDIPWLEDLDPEDPERSYQLQDVEVHVTFLVQDQEQLEKFFRMIVYPYMPGTNFSVN